MPLPADPNELTVEQARAIFGSEETVTRVVITAIRDHITDDEVYADAESLAG